MTSTSNDSNPPSKSPAEDGPQGDKPTILGGILSGKTWGVQNVEAAYSRAGASNHHTPGYASKLGSQEQPTDGQGVGSDNFKGKFSDQRQEPSVIGKVFNNMINGTDSTK